MFIKRDGTDSAEIFAMSSLGEDACIFLPGFFELFPTLFSIELIIIGEFDAMLFGKLLGAVTH